MQLQVADQLPRPTKDPESLAATGKLMSAADLVQLIHRAEQQCQAQMKQQGVTVDTSRHMHDAALAAMTFSHLPPVRLSCIRSLVVPAYTGHCLHLGCTEPSCRGNRLYTMSESPLLLRIKLPHHKNARKWGKAVIEFDLPPDLTQLVHTYLGAPRKALLDHHLLIGDTCPYVFMDMHGRGFGDAAVLSVYWQNWLVSRGGVPMNPSMCRQVFVDERQSNSAAAGPSNQGAAMVMGHSVKQWDKWYDMRYHPRMAHRVAHTSKQLVLPATVGPKIRPCFPMHAHHPATLPGALTPQNPAQPPSHLHLMTLVACHSRSQLQIPRNNTMIQPAMKCLVFTSCKGHGHSCSCSASFSVTPVAFCSTCHPQHRTA